MLTQPDHNNSIFSDKRDTDLLDDKTIQDIRIQRSLDENAFAVGDCTCVQIMIDGQHDKLDFSQTDSLTLGRADMLHSSLDLFDLHFYDAHENGVSRGHCKLTIKWGQLFVTDLDSTNGTFLDDRRLKPYQPYVIKTGTTLRLGHLPITFIQQ